ADLAGPLLDQYSPVARHGDAPGIVAAILKLLEPVQDEPGRILTGADVTENAAHRTLRSVRSGRADRVQRRTGRHSVGARIANMFDRRDANVPSHVEWPLSGCCHPGLLRSYRPCQPGGHPPNCSISPHLVTRQTAGPGA